MDDAATRLADPQPEQLAIPINPRVLIIEDNQPVGETIQRFLERSGIRTEWAQTGARAYELKKSFLPDVVLVDLELPDTSGVTLIRWLTTQQDCGIIVVSGHAEEGERVVGLELGADDYVAKPPQMRELVARIRAVHRRAQRRAPEAAAEASAPVTYMVGPYRVDTRAHSVTAEHGRTVAVTGAEFVVLQMLLEANGQPVSRGTLCEHALRRPWRAEDRSIDQLVFHLRRKLSEADSNGRLIQAVRGAGYFLVRDA